jgi:dipeptidyl aminopeptidase/acylaminoacyl peptidase
MKHAFVPICLAALGSLVPSATFAQRPLMPVDLDTLARVENATLSHDGNWVLYTVSIADTTTDELVSAVWMASWDGKKQIRLTHGSQSATVARWSPNGRHISFLREVSGKCGEKQIWLLDRNGGEATQLTDVRGELTDYAWSPDSKRLALVIREAEPDDRKAQETQENTKADRAGQTPSCDKRPRPLVINRYQFKSDEDGYHSQVEQPRILLYDIAGRTLTALTGSKGFRESTPTWSPDGKRIAFVSNRDEDWDRSENRDVWVAEARAGADLLKLTRFIGDDVGPLSWSQDGRYIAYLQGSEPKYYLYNYFQLGIAPTDGSGAVRLPTAQLDRDIEMPQFSPDGRSLYFKVTDNRIEYLARMPAVGGKVEQLTSGPHVVSGLAVASRGQERVVVLHATSTSPPELFAHENGRLRAITHHNQTWTSQLSFGTTEDFSFHAKDGVEVFGMLTKPPGWQAGKKYPTLLWIHGGPYKQNQYMFDIERQLFSGQDYVVVQVNYRGSSGRGSAFARQLFGDWGNLDASDLRAGIDHIIGLGIADADRLGVGGWSQGGILTNYVIALDQRFKAAMSGAGVANQLGIYGHDQYVFQYDHEFGQPWAKPETWIRISHPFFHADQIRTPTLYIGGDRDFNVPLIGGEQMYQALKSLNRPTQLIIYPGERHALKRPSFVRDRYERYVAWFAKYLKQ